MKTLLSALLLLLLNSAYATNYYFSTSSGNDSRTAAQARNPSTPWRTISKLNSIFRTLKPGDNVLFKRGETFYGTITVSKSGTSRSPIVIGAYGTGNRPVITALVTLTGWRATGYKGVYESAANAALGATLNTVLLNDVQRGMGRYPNADAPNKGYLTFESHSAHKLNDRELSSSPNWKGAELVLRLNHWKIDRYKITGHSGHTLHFPGTYAIDKFGYFIQNSVKTLDQFGEWYYNPSTKKLSMYFGSRSPSSYSVKAASLSFLVTSKRMSYVVFDNLTFKGANSIGVQVIRGNNFTVKNCDIISSGVDGVSVSNHPHFTLENCNVLNSNNSGVNVGGAYAVIRNNTVRNTYYIAGMGRGGDGQGRGIGVTANGLAEYNRVINSGYIGINMTGDNVIIRNNLIDTFSFTKDDAGGIYAYNSGNKNNHGRKIIGNIIMHGLGAMEGTNTTNSVADGIYLDGFINGLEVSGNTITNSNRGIFLHNSRDMVVKNNTMFNNNFGQLNMKHDKKGGGGFRNQTITNNILFSKTPTQKVSVFITRWGDDDIKNIGAVNNNYFARPVNNSELIYTETSYLSSGNKRTLHDFHEWKSKYRKDASSKLSSKTISGDPDSYIKFIYNASKVARTYPLNATYVDAKNVRYSNRITLEPFTSAVLIRDGNAAPREKTRPTVKIKNPIDNATFRGPATINIQADASDEDGKVTKVEFYNGKTLLATKTSAPFTHTIGNAGKGNYKITAKATDNDGNVTTSESVSVSVVSDKKGRAPSVRITNPDDNQKFTGPATIQLVAQVNAYDANIKRVEFYNGNTLIRTEYWHPYRYRWENVPAGTYKVTAKAIDDNGLSTTSDVVHIKVKRRGKASSRQSAETDQIDSVGKAGFPDIVESLKLSPNPAHSTLNISTKGLPQNKELDITVLSVSGSVIKTIKSNTSSDVLQLDVSSFNNGIYIIRVACAGKVLSQQFVKL